MVQINSLGGAIVSFAAYSVYEYILQGFPTDFLFLLQRCLHHIFCTINSYINYICGTIILIAAYSAIGRIYVRFFLEIFAWKFFA